MQNRLECDCPRLCLSRISAWCPPAIFQSSVSALSFSSVGSNSKIKEEFYPIRSMVSIKLSEKKRATLQNKLQQPSPKGGPLGERLKEKEEWVFILERFVALKGKVLLLG